MIGVLQFIKEFFVPYWCDLPVVMAATTTIVGRESDLKNFLCLSSLASTQPVHAHCCTAGRKNRLSGGERRKAQNFVLGLIPYRR